MPASVRAHASRVTSRPYDRRSPTASPIQSESPRLSHPASPTHTDLNATKTPDADEDGDPDIPPDRPGLPTYAEYKRIETGYLLSLSPRKRDKALITQAMFDKIWDVLHQPEACTVGTPQFRFWVRKMFTLSRPAAVGGDGALGLGLRWDERGGDGAGDRDGDSDGADLELERSMGIGAGRTADAAHTLGLTAVVLHENRPVAIMEQLYELFCYCHVRAGHGGRDKTCAVIREHYSWVPKELTAQFVKACPTCTLKRSGQCVEVGVFGHKRVAGRKRKGRALEVPEETSVTSVGAICLGWPLTGGPLDPEPCGERERDWQLRAASGDVGTVGQSSPSSSSPALDSRRQSAPRDAPYDKRSTSGWNSVPRALTLDASPFEFSNTPAVGSPNPFAGKRHRAGTEQHERSPTKMGLGNAAECLRPLRLVGGVPSDTESGHTASFESSHPLQIDPVLLSFNYPGLGLSSESGFASDGGAGVHFDLTLSAAGLGAETHDFTNLSGQSVYRLRAPSDASMLPLPALDSSGLDSPDASFERTLSLPYTPTTSENAVAVLPLSLSTEFMHVGRGRCGSWYDYREGPLAMLYPCPADDLSHELDGSLSFSIMTDV